MNGLALLKPQTKPLRPYQIEAIERLRDSVRAGHRRPVLQAPVGAGKTLVAATIVQSALDKGNRVVFVVPAISLIDQTVEAFEAEGIREVGVMQSDHYLTDPTQPVQVATIQTLMKRSEYPIANVIIWDECHRIWEFMGKWMTDPMWLRKPFIGLSATPWTKGLGRLFDDLIVVSTTEELIKAGYLSPFRVFAPSHPDLSGVRTVAGDYHEGELAEAMDRPPLTANVVDTWLKFAEGRPTLCFAVDRAHAKHLQHEFEDCGVPCGYQDMNTDPSERREIKRKFHSGEYKVVASCETLIMGVDWDVRCISMCRPTKSEMLFCLDTQTEILTSHGWRGRGQIAVGDCAAALTDVETRAGCWSQVLATIDRPMRQSEQWVQYNAPRSNFRITGDHQVIFRPHKANAWRRGSALELARCLDGASMPSAVTIPQPGVPLTNAELYFIGMMMTDGTWTSTAGSISQSERHPEIIERIEDCLRACGFGYGKRRVLPNKSDNMTERYPRWTYSISAGKPKAHHNWGRGRRPEVESTHVEGVTGFRHLLPFMDKDFSPALLAMSRSQFLVMLQGIHDGDGFKMKSPSINWTPRSWTICSARQMFCDRLQALASINGFTANLRREKSPSRQKPLWYLTITPQDWRHVGGRITPSGRRLQIEVHPATEEDVWCIQTEATTIVTRRHGKVTVMGNCQAIGRGLRTAEGKQDLVILDHSDNHLRLGFITDIDASHTGLAGGKAAVRGDAPVPLPKECPQCNYLRPPRVSQCPNCGLKPTPAPPPKPAEGQLAELQPKPQKGLAKVVKRTVVLGKRPVPLADFYAGLLYYARSHGYRDGWASNKYKEAVGVWPTAYKHVAAKPPCMETASWIKSRQIAYAKGRERREARLHAAD